MDAPITIVTDWITNKIQTSATELMLGYVTVLPIMIVVSIGVYVLLNMISSKLANLGVAGVFIYGFLVIL